jgi:hypothetical protein
MALTPLATHSGEDRVAGQAWDRKRWERWKGLALFTSEVLSALEPVSVPNSIAEFATY